MFNKTKKKLEAERQLRQKLENQLTTQEFENRLKQERMQQAQQNELAVQQRELSLKQERMRQAQQNELAAQQRELSLKQQRMREEQQDVLAAQHRENRLKQEQMQQAHERQMQANLRDLVITTSAHNELKQREEERQRLERQKEMREKKKLEDEERERENRQRKLMEASPETLCSLRELIRLKYKLDIEIWGLRGARKPDRWIVQQKMEKADAVITEIMEMVQLWQHQSDGAWDDEEWERVQEIRNRLQTGGIRIWAENQIWNEAQGVNSHKGRSGAFRRKTTVQAK